MSGEVADPKTRVAVVTAGTTLIAYCAIILTTMTGNTNVSLKPILIGSYVEFLHAAPSLAGFVLTAEASATSVATALAAIFIARFNRRHMVLAGAAIIIAGNLLSLLVMDHLVLLGGARALAGAGHGIAFAVGAASIAASHQPDRLAGVMTVSITVLSMGLMLLITTTQGVFGIAPLFWIMGGFALTPLLFLSALPEAAPASLSIPARAERKPQAQFLGITLTAIGFFYVSVGTFYPFAEQLGRAAGLSYADASKILALAGLGSLFGAFLAIGLGDRAGRLLPIGLSIALAMVSLCVLLLFPDDSLVFSGVVITYMFAWATLYPFLLGFTSQLDPSGRVNGFVFSLSLIGFAVGPAIASSVIAIGAPAGSSNWDNLVWVSMLCLLPSFALLHVIRKVASKRSQ
jgi:predicted MFS family arabinose efflux permease